VKGNWLIREVLPEVPTCAGSIRIVPRGRYGSDFISYRVKANGMPAKGTSSHLYDQIVTLSESAKCDVQLSKLVDALRYES
jgi:hypothetical protein